MTTIDGGEVIAARSVDETAVDAESHLRSATEWQ